MIRSDFLFTLGILLFSIVSSHAQTVDSSNIKSAQPQQAGAVTGRENQRVRSASDSTDLGAKSKSELQRRTSEAKKYYKLGVMYGEGKRFKDAAASFLQAIRLKPDYIDAYYGLGHAYYDLQRWEESIKAFEKVLSLDPKDEQAYTRLGELYQKVRAAERVMPSPRSSSLCEQKAGLDEISNKVSSTAVLKVEPPTDLGLTSIYKVGIGDVLEVRLLDGPADASTLFTITANGFLEYPALDRPLKAAGLTPEEIGEKLKSELRRTAVRENPEVAVGVRQYNSHTILISGLVKEPGTKILRREAVPLYVVLADAQTLTEAARVTIIPGSTERSSVVELSNPQSTDVLIHPSDVIMVQPARQQFFYIGGEVKSPGEKSFRLGLMLTQALLAAGGVTEKAKKVELAREGSEGLLVIAKYRLEEINSGKFPDPPVKGGDRITVIQ